ncbi:permease [Bacillus licheniformis]|nr:permease [Bacillus licheniformis]
MSQQRCRRILNIDSLAIGQNDVSSSLVMMGLSFVLSLCSEVDAFIASSFSSTFPSAPSSPFSYSERWWTSKSADDARHLQKRFVFVLIPYIAVIVLAGSLLVKG